MRIPRHMAVIPDGNRRWAQGGGLKKQEGYVHGLYPGVQCMELAQQYGIEELTYYGFTTDNCKRPREEVRAFSEACVEAVRMIQQHDAALLVVGNDQSAMFPDELRPYTQERVRFGAGTTKVNFLVNYGWEWDLGDMHTASRDRKRIMGELRSSAVSRIDLVVRWGGRRRLSGLLPVQTVYADIYTLDELWPDFEPAHLERALLWYDKQDVTMGG